MTLNAKTNWIIAARWAAIAFVGANIVGCAAVKMPAPTASVTNIETLKAANLAPSKAGAFYLAAGKNPEMDKTLGGLRGSTLSATNGSFSQQLKDEMLVELKAAGLYDENSQIVIGAQLMDSQVDAAIGTGTAKLAAHFTVDRSGNRVYDKDLAVDAKWESSFVGAVALPMAINQYNALYKSLLTKLFSDPAFRTAVAR